MKMNEDKYKGIEDLLPRFCEGRTSEGESRLVEEWIAEDEEHLKMIHRIHALHLATDAMDVMKHTDLDKVLDKVKGRMHAVSRVPGWEWTQRIAAVLSIPLLLGCLWLYFEGDRRVPEVAQMMEISTNPGMTTRLMLPDSTLVCLNSESTLRYPSRFSGDVRQVELTGEAFFDVARNEAKRFVVQTEHDSQVEVYGTRFNIEAYPSDAQVSTTLIEGSVGFLYKDKRGQAKKINLKPNQKLVYTPAEEEVQLYATSGESETAWKDGRIVFDNTPMDEVLRMLGKRFNVEFVVKSKRLDEYAFTGTFTSQRLERIMEYFKISSRIKWRYLESGEMKDEKQKIEIY